MNTAPGDELLLRISWYPTDNGDGSAIDSADSTATVTGAPAGFRLLDTGSVQAPADARSARIRLLMRPTSAAPTRAFFDGAQFVPASALSSPTQGATNASGSTAHPGGSSAITPSTSAPAVLGAVSTPVRLTNAEPAVNSQPVPVHSSGSSKDWLLALALLLPVGGIAAVLGAPAVLRGRRSDSAE